MAEEATMLEGASNGAKAATSWRDDVSARVSAEVAQLSERCDALAEQLADARAEHRQALTILRAIDPEQAPVKVYKNKKRSGSTSSSGSEPMRGKMARGMLTFEDRFTLLELHHKVLGDPWSEPHSYTMMKWFRERELVGKGAKDPSSKRQTWKILDREALEALAQHAED